MSPSSAATAPRARKQPAPVATPSFDWARLKLPGCYLLLLVLTLAVYGQMARGVYFFWPGTQFAFVGLDDGDYMFENQNIKRGLTLGGIRWAFTENFSANWHPLTWISLMADVSMYGLEPGGAHVTNMLWHLGSVFLLFLLVSRMTGRVGASLLVASLWAVHPLHAESVAWVSERKDVMSTFFALLALVAYERYARRPSLWRYLAIMAAYCLSLLSKQMWVTFPCVLILLDYWPMRRFHFGKTPSEASDFPTVRWQRLVWEKIPFFALAIGFSVMIFIVQRNAGAVVGLDSMSPSLRIKNATVSYWIYLYKTVWPVRMAVMYPYPPGGHPWTHAAAAGAVLLGISGLALYGLRRWPWLAVGWLWYLGTLVPVIGLVHIGSQAWADRYTYVPHIGLFMAVVWSGLAVVGWLQRRFSRQWLERAALATAVVAVLALTVRGHQQVALWRSTETLFAHTVAVTDKNYSMAATLASFLDAGGDVEGAKHYYKMALDMDYLRTEALVGLSVCIMNNGGELEEAIRLLEMARKIDPNDASAMVQLSLAYVQQQKFDEAVEMLKRVPAINPAKAPISYVALGIAESARGDLETAEKHFAKAIELDDTNASHLNVLGGYYLQRGEFDRAEKLFHRVLHYSPDDITARLDLGALHVQRGQLDQAMRLFEEAVRLRPNHAEAHNRLAAGLMALGKVPQAIVEYETAIRLRPDSPGPVNDLAWTLATDESSVVRSGPRAVELAKKACKLTKYQDASMLDTLAAAYAEVGRWEDARANIEMAIQIESAFGRADTVARMKARAELYRQKKPYRASSRAAAEEVRIKN